MTATLRLGGRGAGVSWSECFCPQIHVGVLMLKALGVIRSQGGALMELVLLYKRPEGVYLCLYYMCM